MTSDPAHKALLAERAARYARPIAAEASGEEHVAFARGGSRCAVALSDLREIAPLTTLCRIPSARPAVPGVFHYRGAILSAHDVAAFLSDGTGTDAPWVVVVHGPGGELGLLADDVVGVVEIEEDQVVPVPVTFGERSSCFRGMLRDDTLLLDIAGLFETPAFYNGWGRP